MEKPRIKPEWKPTATERWIGVVGLVLSVGLSIVVPLMAQSSSSQIDVLLGIGGFVIGFLITMDLTTRAHLRAIEDRLMERLAEVEESRYGALPMQRLLSVPDIEDAITDIVIAAAEARSKRMPFLANRTIERIHNDRNETLRISQGIFRCEDRREELRLLRGALEDSQFTVNATSALGIDAWLSDEFTEYFDIYLDFAEALNQTRVFLVEEGDVDNPDMLELLERHAKTGVNTFAVDKARLPSTASRPAVIFDDSLLLVHSSMIVGDRREVHFTDDPNHVRDAIEDFDNLMRRIRRKGEAVLWSSESGTVTPRRA